MKYLLILIFTITSLFSIFSEGEEDYDYEDDYYPEDTYNYDRVIDRELYENDYLEYRDAIINTRDMVGNSEISLLVQNKGLNLLNITWEDTGRYLDSSVGPNISDMTIQVGLEDPVTGEFEVFLMPVIRYPNYSDLSTDLDPQEFTLLVGNEKDLPLKRVSLYELLQDPTAFLSNPDSWPGNIRKTLLADRDTKVLVSAQACFLPVPKEGIATFNPVLFNYQSYAGDPAVLTILATREGTSITIIDNTRDAFSSGSLWGQRLFFNRNGERASLTGQRISDFVKDLENSNTDESYTPIPDTQESGLNMVLLIQVPLKQKHPMDYYMMDSAEEDEGVMYLEESAKSSDIEEAVIGSGEIEGIFTEIDNIEIERDPNFPVRVTVQFYKATATGNVSEQDVIDINNQIQKVYDRGGYISSLVTGGGQTGRITEYEGVKVQPDNWWEVFWERYEKNTGIDRSTAIRKLKELIGAGYNSEPVSDLYLRDLLKE